MAFIKVKEDDGFKLVNVNHISCVLTKNGKETQLIMQSCVTNNNDICVCPTDESQDTIEAKIQAAIYQEQSELAKRIALFSHGEKIVEALKSLEVNVNNHD